MRTENQRGVSLVELLITVVGVSTLAAVAVPQTLHTLHGVQLNSAATSMSNIFARTRYEAIKANTPLSCLQTTINGQPAFYVDLNGDGAWQSTEPVAYIPAGVSLVTSGYPLDSTMGYSSTTTAASTTAITFDQRGVPTFSTVYVYHLTHVNPKDGYRAVAVNAMGKTKIWRATPSSWIFP